MADLPMTTCPRCKARSNQEGETMCRPTQDMTGEYSCPGVEWPLEQLWAGEITEAEVTRVLEAEAARWDAMLPLDAAEEPCS